MSFPIIDKLEKRFEEMSLRSQKIPIFHSAQPSRFGLVAWIDPVYRFLSPYPKRLVLCFCDALITALSGYLTVCLDRSVFPLNSQLIGLYLRFLPALVCARLAFLIAFGIYRIVARHTGLRDILRLLAATTCSSLLFLLYLQAFQPQSVSLSAVFIGWYSHLFLVVGSRVGYRLWMQAYSAHIQANASAHRMLILGAGVRGASLARELVTRAAGVRVVGFLDDDVSKHQLMINGAPVLGTTRNLRQTVESKKVDVIAIAIGSANGSLLRDVMQQCEGLNVRFQIAPSMDILKGNRPLQTLRDVCLEDLLRREPVSADPTQIASYITGERVLVTGAGGSIGSELVRQIVACKPAELFLLGHGENSLFEIQQEILRTTGIVPACLVVDIRDYSRLLRMFVRYRPTVVFHAAAHKHVGLMEANPEEAVTNNVLGTRNLARLATKTGVKRFVMISTDKAVNPTSVMGMTKRAAEKVIMSESRRSSTEFACVRFGNVLGSRGSVVPLMRKQIANGGPVTVTHPEINRYFMTIPEAAQLVIQAGAMGGKCAVYLLEMGAPVRILDLANDLIRLSGLTPGKDIAIEFTGLRQGEKLYEELLTAEEGAKVTQHERIYAAPAPEFDGEALDMCVDALIASAQAGDTYDMLFRLKNLDMASLKSQVDSLDEVNSLDEQVMKLAA